ncbi:regulator of G-protein signaling 4-like [Anguilla anguilla]|uniref:RGS domain-containing protein n=1 Tax=Anguilla anguilla TaxID=7936 RepID=A0A9D3MJR8_ANGAN|nr:regulator of G-protein signaling 4-like [Anguilla anguilla]KAG5847433.1 hypothetical protein ANANG_G00126010 [Anguilla anguilla]
MCKGLAALPATCLKSAKDMKHWIGNRLQKPDKGGLNTKNRAQTMAPEAKSADMVEIYKWGESLDMLINDEAGLKTFSSFLKSEFSQENIEFWMECEEYRRMTSKKKLANKAKEIYSVYVDAESPKQVNLDSATREKTGKNMVDVSLSCFEEAQRMIFRLMEKDSYRRFLKSRLFLDLVQDSHCIMAESTKQSISILLTA